MNSKGRTGSQLTRDEILTLELWYTTTPMEIREMCSRLNVRYTSFQSIRKKYFPDAVRHQMTDQEAVKVRIKALGLTEEDIEDIRELYIAGELTVSQICESYDITEWYLDIIRKAYFPEYSRTGFCHAVSCNEEKKKKTLPKPRPKLELADGYVPPSRLSASDKKWLEQNWHWKTVERKKKKESNYHTRAICSSGRRFG